jgi:DNA-binding transcriptional MerR regulator
MIPSSHAVFLEPIDLSQHLYKLELYLGQVCRIAGISKMQLDYWTNKAQIPTKGRKQRIYDLEALETVMLIKQGKDKGLNLGAAIEAARRFQAARHAVEAEAVLEAQEAERSLAAASSGASVLT